MTKGLRSRLAQYGDEAFALFLRRGFLKGAGYTDDALDRPIVVVTHRVPLSKAPKAYPMFVEKRDQCIKVVLDPAA